MNLKLIFLGICILPFYIAAQTFSSLVQGIKTSFRGIDTFGNKTVWVSGSNGTVGYSIDYGLHWNWVNPKGYASYDFRDIEVFSETEALIMSSGTPTVILKTKDAGQTWKEVFRENDKSLFLDAISFEGKLGYALADPIEGLFQLYRTTDKGNTWQNATHEMSIFADEGEAAFAASGSSIQLLNGTLFIGTGGTSASIFNYIPKKRAVSKFEVPILQGNNSSGIFAIDFLTKQYGVAVGGDYTKDKENQNNVLWTADGGITWHKPQRPVHGYRSDVLFINHTTIIATGTSGTDISHDKGNTWTNISTVSFNSVAKSADSKTIYLTGSNGDVYKLIL